MKTICLVLVVKLSVAFLSARESLLLTTIRQVSRSSVGVCPPLICSGGFPCFTIGLVFLHLRRVIISDEISSKFSNEFHSQIWDPGISNGGSEDRHMKFRSTFIHNPCSLFYLPAVSLLFVTNLQVWKQSGDNTLSPVIVSGFGNQVRILSYDDDAICKSWAIAISVFISAFDGFRHPNPPWILLYVLTLFFNCSIRLLSDLQNQHITWDKFFVGLSDRLRFCEGWCLFTSNSCPVELFSSVYLLRWKQSWGRELFNRSIQNSCRCELQSPHSHAVGSTAVVSVVTPERIIVSNGGDSRAVICRNSVAIALSVDHKPDRPVLLCVWIGISRTKGRAKVTFFCFIVFPKRITQAQYFQETLVRWCHYVSTPELVLDTSALMLCFVKKKSQPKVAVHNS